MGEVARQSVTDWGSDCVESVVGKVPERETGELSMREGDSRT